MVKRLIVPLLFGLLGAVYMARLGFWQLERLEWKTEMLAQIDAKIVSAPVDIPSDPTEARDQFLPVKMVGLITDDEVHILASVKKIGPGYRIISAFEVDDGRRVMLDRGFVALTAKEAPRPDVRAEIVGNLLWPDEMDSATPEPDLTREIWFARDVTAMAKVLGAEPVLVVQRDSSEAARVTSPFPVDSSGIPNRHLEYVFTWFGLAIVWLGMTAYLIWRMRPRADVGTE